jgi:hypothetical protein
LLANLPGNGEGIGVDAANVYVTTGSTATVVKVPKAGGTLTTIYSAGGGYVDSIFVDPGSTLLFVTNSGNGIVYGLTNAGAVQWTETGQTGASGLFADANNVYWGNSGTTYAQISRANKFSGGVITVVNSQVAAGGSITGLAFDPGTNHLFASIFSSPGIVASCPTAGGACATQSTYPYLKGVTVSGNHVFFSARGTSPNYTDGGIYTVTTSMGGYQVVATGSNYAALDANVTSDPVNVFWPGNDGNIYVCPVAGCSGTPTALATGQPGAITSITNDVNAVYWTGTNNTVMKLAK